MNSFQREDLLILTKTYPEPSTKYRETTCVAALTRGGAMRRVFPVPFRHLGGDAQFQKWEWIDAALKKANDDHRPESFKIDLDSGVGRHDEKIGTQNEWTERRSWVEPHIVAGFSALEQRRQISGETLGFLRVARLLQLEIVAANEGDWNERDKTNLAREGLFDSGQHSRPLLRKLPFGFYYRYECESENGTETLRHKITDWEAGALYWNCVRDYGSGWEEKFRQKLEIEFARKELMLLMGTIHRFPNQWLIVGLFYPPKPKPDAGQLTLL